MAALACLAGCRGEEPPAPKPHLRVQMVFSEVGDPKWSLYGDGISRRLQEKYIADVSSVLADSEADRRSILNSGGTEAIDLIVCAGPGFERAVLSEGPRFPRSAFLLDQGDVIAPNVARMEFVRKGAAYLAGVTAAILGGSSVGIIEGDQGVETVDIEDGFEQGFRRRHPWGRIERASGPAGIQALADLGVEVALYATIDPDPDCLRAAAHFGVRLVTISKKSLQENADVVVAAIVVDLAEAVSRITADVVDDTFIGRVYAFDLGSGVVDLMLQPALSENLALTEALDQARAAVNAGMVEIESLGL